MKQNVLFILVDCLRADKCYGDKRTAVTPNIDSLVKKGVFFSKTIATTTTTTPSVASLFTGLYTFGHGIRSLYGYKLADGIKTLAEVFKDNGYNTYAEVTGPLVSDIGLDRGFDKYSYRDRNEYFVDKWGDNFVTKFRKSEFKEPWFMFIHLWELHDPRHIPKEFNSNKFGKNKYERALSGLDAKLGDLFKFIDFNTTAVILSGDHGEKIIESMPIEYIYEFKEHLKKLTHYLTKVFARIIKKIFRLMGFEANWLSKYVKHGFREDVKKPASFQLFGHAFHISDSAIITPLIIATCNKALPKSGIISTQVRQIDIFPTIVDICALKIDKKFDIHGRSLIPSIMGESVDPVPAHCETCGVIFSNEKHWNEVKKYWKAGLRTSKYKFIYRPYDSDAHEELYDLETDPLEKNNIIKSQPELANSLRKQLLSIRVDDSCEPKSVGQEMSSKEKSALMERLKSLGYIE